MNVNQIESASKAKSSSITKTTSSNKSSSDFASHLNTETNKLNSLEDIFQRAAKKYGVDVNLLKAIAKTESEFQPDATSHSGAMGIMQLMPKTAEYLGVKDAYDPEENIMGGAKLISQLLKQYNGNTTLALAAYNAGSGNVKKYGGVPPFKETQNYVKKVQNYYKSGVTIPDSRQNVASSSKTQASPDVTASVPSQQDSISIWNVAPEEKMSASKMELQSIRYNQVVLDLLLRMNEITDSSLNHTSEDDENS